MIASNWEFIKFTLIAVLIVVPIRLWIAQPFIVNGASMEPTFENGDYLIVDELSYNVRKPEKNEVIIFHYPLDPSKYFIKRVEGLPGEKITINGKEIVLGEDSYYVLGDNRGASSDSRIWGPVKEDLIVGRALIRLWPFNKITVMPGQDYDR
jgi:signal peptidase I